MANLTCWTSHPMMQQPEPKWMGHLDLSTLAHTLTFNSFQQKKNHQMYSLSVKHIRTHTRTHEDTHLTFLYFCNKKYFNRSLHSSFCLSTHLSVTLPSPSLPSIIILLLFLISMKASQGVERMGSSLWIDLWSRDASFNHYYIIIMIIIINPQSSTNGYCHRVLKRKDVFCIVLELVSQAFPW